MNFLEPLQYPFMQNALLIGSITAALCAVLSCFVILKGWSLMGDAISHAVLPGIVLAYLAGWPLAAGAFLSGLLCSTAAGYIKQHSRIREDTVLGVVFTGLFAFGLVLHSRTQSELHLDHILFGNLLGITRETALQLYGTAALVMLTVLVLRRDLLLVCFDPSHARVMALPVRFLTYLLLALLVLTIVAALQAVGIILVIAMLITPGCTAHLWTDRFDRMLAIAAGSAVASTAAGILVSYHVNGDTAACIVLAQSLVFVLSFLFAPKHGWLASRRRAQQNSAFPSALS
jgi:ABC-type Mn2+/Zn2+ transport system permease subunit